MKQNLLVTLADRNYIQQAKQLFSSVYWNAGWEGVYMLLAHKIPEEELKWFTDKGILIRKCEQIHNKPLGIDNYSPVILDKFYLFTEEFKKWEHIVFVDSDVIVKAPLNYLTRTKAISCLKVTNNNFGDMFSSKDTEEFSMFMLEKEYNLIRPAFSSGVMAFDTNIIKEDTFNKLILLFTKYKEIVGCDDSVLNLFFYDQWVNIPLVFNARVNHIVHEKINGIVLHFERPFRSYKKDDKPWDEGNPFYQEWKTNLEKAEFIDLNKVQKTKKWNFFKIAYYSLTLKIIHIYVTNYKIKLHNITVKLKLFLIMIFDKLKASFLYIFYTPERLIGKIGNIIKRYNSDLYYKLKKPHKN